MKSREDLLAEQLASALAALCDLRVGYPWKELHIDLDTMLAQAADAGVFLEG